MQVQKNVLFSFFVISFLNSTVFVVIHVFHILTYHWIVNKKKYSFKTQLWCRSYLSSSFFLNRSNWDKYLIHNQYLNQNKRKINISWLHQQHKCTCMSLASVFVSPNTHIFVPNLNLGQQQSFLITCMQRETFLRKHNANFLRMYLGQKTKRVVKWTRKVDKEIRH